MKSLNRIPSWIYLMGLFILALAVRLLHITDTDIAGDEPFSIFMAQFPVSEIIGFLNTGNNPPLFEILLHYYMLWVGDSDFLLRLFPSILSAFTVVPIFLVGSKFFNRTVGFTAALLFIFSIYNIRFAHEVRVYSLFTLAFAWVLYFFLSALKEPQNFKWWVGVFLGNVILLYAHYLSFYILLVQGVTGMFFLNAKHWKYLIAVFLFTAFAYSPSLVVFLKRFGKVSGAGTWVQPPGWGEVYGSVNLLLNDRITTVAVVLLIIVGLVVGRRKKLFEWLNNLHSHNAGVTVFLWFIIPYGLMFLVSKFFLPMFIDRYILFTSVPLYLSVSWLVNEAWKSSGRSKIGGALLVLASVLSTDLNPDNDREIAATVTQIIEWKDPNTQVYFAPNHFNLAFAYHFDRELFKLIGQEEPTSSLDNALRSKNIHPINTSDEVMAGASNVVYLDAASEFVNPNNGILDKLNSEMLLKDSVHFHQIFDVYLFEFE